MLVYFTSLNIEVKQSNKSCKSSGKGFVNFLCWKLYFTAYHTSHRDSSWFNYCVHCLIMSANEWFEELRVHCTKSRQRFRLTSMLFQTRV